MSDFELKELEDGTLEIVKLLTDKEKRVVIPSDIDGKTVSGIGPFAFYMRSAMNYVVIPNTIKYIESCAFSGCTRIKVIYFTGTIQEWCKIKGLGSLMGETNFAIYGSKGIHTKSLIINNKMIEGNLVIPRDVETIDNSAFSGIEDITSVTIPNTVKEIGTSAFAQSANITNVVMEDGDEPLRLHSQVFANCFNLKRVQLSNRLKRIGQYCFYGCNNIETNKYDNGIYIGSKDNPYFMLLKICDYKSKYIIHDSCRIIGSKASFNNSKQEELYIPKNVISIGDYAFEHSLIEKIIIDEDAKLEIINDYAFANMPKLKEFKLPKNVKYIGLDAFCRSQKIKEMILPHGLEKLGGFAFFECFDIKKLFVPSTLKSFPKTAIYGCKGLEYITFEDGFKVSGFDKNIFEWFPNIKSIETGNKISRNMALAILYYGIQHRNGSMIQEKYLDCVYRTDFDELVTLARKYDFVTALQSIIVKYNERNGESKLRL